MTAPVLVAERVGRVYRTPAGDVRACVDVDLDVRPGQLVVVRGPSGSGKTTLLNLLGGIDRTDSGRVVLDGDDLTGLSEEKLAAIRGRAVGFVFQSFGLLPMLTAAENVEIPLRMRETAPPEREARVREVLELVGLTGHAAQRPAELSGGEQQRVGIARALSVTPRVVVADEPTGQLDSRTARSIMDLVVDVVHRHGVAAVVATHDPALVERADTVLTLHDGRRVEPDATIDA